MINLSSVQKQTQIQTLAPQMRQGIELLTMNLPELRLRLDKELSENPCIEDVEQTLVTDTVSEKLHEAEERTDNEADGYPEDDYEPEYGVASAITGDEDANERRQRFFDNQTKEDQTVTVRERDTMAQSRLPIADLTVELLKKLR